MGEVHQSLVGFATGACPCGHVRIVAPQQSHPRSVHRFEFVEIRLPLAFRAKIVGHRLCTEQTRERSVGGVTRIGHQHLVAGVDKGQCRVKNPLFRADERLNFALGIQFHTEPSAIEARHGFAQFACADRRLVSVRTGFTNGLAKGVDRGRRRGKVGATDGQTHNIVAGGIEASHFFEFAREVILLHVGKSACGADSDVHGVGGYLAGGVFA